METVRHLNQVSRLDLDMVGGKAANLGEVAALGAQVPPGFVITTDCYSEQTLRWVLIDRLAPLVERKDWNATAAEAETIISGASFDQEFLNDIKSAYRELAAPLVAVRSSATTEDLPSASFAGQHFTGLNIKNCDELIHSIRECWISLWSRPALEYRTEHHIDHLSSRMAVIVQTMVASEFSGVLFTFNPMARASDNMLLEVVSGSGEALVSGIVTGDRYHIHRVTGEFRGNRGNKARIPREIVQELHGWALKIEGHFGVPQDIEFATDGDKVFILQARPITTLDRPTVGPLPLPPKPSLVDKAMKPIAAERYVVAPLPLDNVVFTRLVGAVIYTIRQSGGFISADSERDFKAQIWRQAYRVPQTHLSVKALFPWRRYIQILRQDFQSWWRKGPHLELLAIAKSTDLSSLNDSELLARMDRILSAWEQPLNERFYITTAVATESWLKGIISLAVGRKRAMTAFSDLMSGIETATTKVNHSLWSISRFAQQNRHVAEAVARMDRKRLAETPAGNEVLKLFDRFIEEHGHREGSCYYLSTPTWRHDPTPVWRMLKSLIETEREAPNDTDVSRFEAAHQLIIGRLRFYPGLKHLFTWLVQRLRDLQRFREDSHYDITRPLAALQDIVQAMAHRLTNRGILENIDDIYYLTHSELHSLMVDNDRSPDINETLIAGRRRTYQIVNARWQAERLTEKSIKKKLKGVGASPGLVQGTVRIIRNENHFDCLLPGDVLVCPHSNPAWTPLFSTAVAVVAETGGVTSHAAIVAREYGIPAVLGISGAVGKLKDGDRVTVDGDRGIVRVLQSEANEVSVSRQGDKER